MDGPVLVLFISPLCPWIQHTHATYWWWCYCYQLTTKDDQLCARNGETAPVFLLAPSWIINLLATWIDILASRSIRHGVCPVSPSLFSWPHLYLLLSFTLREYTLS
ncbi:MAG: hypothetical protein BYD32DRAFT_416549 [Podila humilis]|nr:MAG: hypothetical protein BYD32DRAFT_416549 [Podila humilis]